MSWVPVGFPVAPRERGPGCQPSHTGSLSLPAPSLPYKPFQLPDTHLAPLIHSALRVTSSYVEPLAPLTLLNKVIHSTLQLASLFQEAAPDYSLAAEQL